MSTDPNTVVSAYYATLDDWRRAVSFDNTLVAA
jgi:hypothetical protein